MNMPNNMIIYLGGAVPEYIESQLQQVDLLPHLASQKFSWSVIRALQNSFNAVYNISSCDIRNYPAASKLLFGSRSFFRNGAQGFFIGFINLLVLKHISRMIVLLLLSPFVMIRRRARFLLVHGSHTPFMLIAILTKFFFRVRIAILLTDQHGSEVPSDGRAGRFFRSLDTWLMRFLLYRFDAYICLSPVFVSKFGLRNVFVVPGILNEDFRKSVLESSAYIETSIFFDIVFAGGVTEENGVDSLIRALQNISDPRVRLFVYGAGPLVGDVVSMEQLDTRIHYGGTLHGDEFTRALLAASLLINPRPVGKEYAQTSFPSKLIEYMATGVPILTTRLIGIPEEIRDCFYFIDGDSEESIAHALINTMNISYSDRLNKGRMTAERVSILYGEVTFGRRVFDLLR
jgi:glycosyltransferase involved in cell wall biosynthesis